LSCPRPKCYKKAKRFSGGVIVFFKQYLSKGIELVQLNNRGVIWFKLKRTFIGIESDVYICATYIPPQESSVLSNINSPLYEYDFFYIISADIVRYGQLGDVMLAGDHNARVGQRLDVIDNINLDRFVEMPLYDVRLDQLPLRLSKDNHSNVFGNKLLSLCKENGIFIVNGRLEPGHLTCYNFTRNTFAASVVDYVILNNSLFECIADFKVNDLTEFSDHCPIEFALKYNNANTGVNTSTNYDTIIWDKCDPILLQTMLENKRHLFDDITSSLLTGNCDPNECINKLDDVYI